MVLIAILGDRQTRLGDEAKPFYLFVIAGLLLSPLAVSEGIKDLFLTFAGVSVALLIQIPKVRIWNVFWVILAGFVVENVVYGNFHGGFKWDISNSESSFEGNFGFMFALLTSFALMQRRYRLVILSILLSVLALKRIALLAEIGVIFFYWIGERRGKLILNSPVMVFLNLLLIVIVVSYSTGQFNQIITQLTGQSANQFGQGRQEIQAVPSREIIAHPLNFIFVGKGSGASYELATKGFGSKNQKTNLHSDLLKLVYEYGFLFFMAFIWLMYSSRSYNTRLAFLLMNILFLTDNVLIYYFLIFFLVVCIRLFAVDEKSASPVTGFKQSIISKAGT